MHGPDRLRRPGIAGLCTVASLLLLLPVAGASAAADPAPVRQAIAATATLINGSSRSVAFAIDDHGGFMTTEQAASRGSALQLILPGGRTVPATRLDSDAPTGLALVRASLPSPMPALGFAVGEAKVGSTTWVVAPANVIRAPVRSRVRQPPTEFSAVGVLYLQQRKMPALMGSPVLNSAGQVIGVVRANRPSNWAQAQAIIATKVPRALPAIVPPKRNDFPATAVTLGLAIVLLLAALVLRPLRRRDLNDVATLTLPTSNQRAPAAVPVYDDAEDLGIVLRRGPSTAAPPAGVDGPEDRIEIRPR